MRRSANWQRAQTPVRIGSASLFANLGVPAGHFALSLSGLVHLRMCNGVIPICSLWDNLWTGSKAGKSGETLVL